jgi:hypothetical protein
MALDEQKDSGGPDQDRTGDLCHSISQSKTNLLILQGPDRHFKPYFRLRVPRLFPKGTRKSPGCRSFRSAFALLEPFEELLQDADHD